MKVFHFWEKETVYFPNVSVFSCILLPMKWANNNKLSSLWHWKLNKWIRIKNIKGYRHYVSLLFLVLFRHLHLSLLIPLQNHRGKHQKKARLGPCMLRSNEKKCFTRQKTAETKHRLCKISPEFRITPYINNIMHTAIVQRKQKAEQY